MAGPLNETVQKFFSDDRFIFETSHWMCVLRPKQVTLGSTILMSKSFESSFGSLSSDEFIDMKAAIQKLESIYQATLKPDKINYLALMMVDPNPHFHVLPRFSAPRALDGIECVDKSWPKPPDLSLLLPLNDSSLINLAKTMRDAV